MYNIGRKVLLQQIMRQQQTLGANLRSCAGEPSETLPENDNINSAQMVETTIYVGLNDADTKAQKHETGKYISILKHVCRNYHVAFSMGIEEGGYFHDDGAYTEETSLVLVLVNPDRNTVREIAKDLCTFFHQESVLVTEGHIEGYFVTPSTD